jgi:hypothetical protein
MAQHILSVGTRRGEWSAFFTPGERGHGADLIGRRVGPYSRSGCYGEEKNFFRLPRIEGHR